jgi:hypothetical protein
MNWIHVFAWLALLGCSTNVADREKMRQVSELSIPCPLSFGGLKPGHSQNRDVVALYGEGDYDPDGGDSGSRTYRGSGETVVRFIFGDDYVVDRIVIEKRGRNAVSGKVTEVPLHEMLPWSRLLPEATIDTVKRAIGQPYSVDGNGLIYRPDVGACASGGIRGNRHGRRRSPAPLSLLVTQNIDALPFARGNTHLHLKSIKANQLLELQTRAN